MPRQKVPSSLERGTAKRPAISSPPPAWLVATTVLQRSSENRIGQCTPIPHDQSHHGSCTAQTPDLVPMNTSPFDDTTRAVPPDAVVGTGNVSHTVPSGDPKYRPSVVVGGATPCLSAIAMMEVSVIHSPVTRPGLPVDNTDSQL